MAELLIRKLLQDDCSQIAGLFGADRVLRGELGFVDGDQPTSDDVEERYREWCQSKSAIAYAVVLDGKATIGCICLSRIDSRIEPARIAGWIASDYRGKGYGAAAFDQVLVKARRRGVPRVRATSIEEGDALQESLLKRFGGVPVHTDEGRAYVELALHAA